jgi:hypothetical protein
MFASNQDFFILKTICFIRENYNLFQINQKDDFHIDNLDLMTKDGESWNKTFCTKAKFKYKTQIQTVTEQKWRSKNG